MTQKTNIQEGLDELDIILRKTGRKSWALMCYEEEEEDVLALNKAHALKVQNLVKQGLYEFEEGEIIE
jgi:hypothetical protein